MEELFECIEDYYIEDPNTGQRLPRHLVDPNQSIFTVTTRSKFLSTDPLELQNIFAQKNFLVEEDVGFRMCSFDEDGLSILGDVDKERSIQGESPTKKREYT